MIKNLAEAAKDSASNELVPKKSSQFLEVAKADKGRKRNSKKKLFRSANKGRLSGGADDAPEDNTAASANKSGGPEDNSAGNRSVRLNDSSMSGPEDNASRAERRESQISPGNASSMDVHQTRSSTELGPTDRQDGKSGGPEDNAQEGQALSTTGAVRLLGELNVLRDPRVDEMLNCALLNLAEANKALANLGENLEHELKLFLVELMGRTRKWTSQIESKIEWSRKDILNLHHELAKIMSALKDSRRESDGLRDQLSEINTRAVIHGADGMSPETKRHDKTGQLVLSALPSSRSVQLDHQSNLLSPRSASRSHLSHSGRTGPVDPQTLQAEEEQLQACCAELEAEVQELRKENERIVKERAEYENAIQRALLKGVSSLNVEALKVLRCSPIPNCCPPCPPSSTIEPLPKPRDCSTILGSGGIKSPNGNENKCFNSGRGATAASLCRSHNSKEALNACNGNGRRVCPSSSAHHQERKQRKSRDNNMLLLLRQKDAENYGIQTGSNTCDNSPKKNSSCSGGNCGKYSKSNYMC